MEKLFFLGGICRSGATVLGSIMNQNPDVHVNVTSPLVELCIKIEESILLLEKQYTFEARALFDNLMKEMHKIYFKDINKKYIIDNGRSWPGNVAEIKKHIDPNPKLICTYRSIPEVVTSFIAMDMLDQDNAMRFILNDAKKVINTKNLAEVAWDIMSRATWESLRKGLQLHPENILLVKYDDLVSDPGKQIDRIYEFLEIPKFDHQFENIVNTLEDPKDYSWGFRTLHKIREKGVSKASLDPREVLGDELYEHYLKYDKLLFEGIDANRLRR